MEKKIDKMAGKKPSVTGLIKKETIEKRYYHPDKPLQPVKNGTSGHRGKTGSSFSVHHVASMTQALADIRKKNGFYGPPLPLPLESELSNTPLGPVVMGKDVRFSSDFAQITAAEVFAGNEMTVIVQSNDRSTPTPVVSHTILRLNKLKKNAEGVVITASHNPPEDAGYKSNGRDGGPNTKTDPVDKQANRYLKNCAGIKQIDFNTAKQKGVIIEEDMLKYYVEDLKNVVDMNIIKKTAFGVTPLGGAANGYYEAINDLYGTKIDVVFSKPDPASQYRTYDWDGTLRGDPSSKYVMMAVDGYLKKMGVPFIGANDNDADRFGGIDSSGILNPNHVLCVIFDYLVQKRNFKPAMGVGRTIGTTHMLDKIAARYNRPVKEVNVGFKWYVEGLLKREYVMAGEESAGLSFPRLDGSLWVTEKDGIAAVLLIMEIIADTGYDIGQLYLKLVSKYGPHQYDRIDTPATAPKKARLIELSSNPNEVKNLLQNKKIAGRNIEALIIGDGVKVVLEGGVWVLKRPSGTEDIIKDYQEEAGESLQTAAKASLEIDHYLNISPAADFYSSSTNSIV